MTRSITAALATLLAAAPVAAQSAAPTPVWLAVLTEEGVRIAIDSVSLSRTGDSTWTTRTLIHFADTLAMVGGVRFDRQEDVEELDCAGKRVRALSTVYLLGDTEVADAVSEGEWQAMPAEQMPYLELRCQFLRGSFAASLPVTAPALEATAVEELPRLLNEREVVASIWRNYPDELKSAGREATIEVSFVVDVAGRPELNTLQVMKADLPSLLAAAQRIVPEMHFRPARIDGRPVRVRVQLPITFHPDRGAPPLQPTMGSGVIQPRTSPGCGVAGCP